MRASSILLGSLGVAAVLAGPVDRRAYTTEVSVVTVTTYVTLSTLPTAAPQPTTPVVPVEEAKAVVVTTSVASAQAPPPAAAPPAPVETMSAALVPTTLTTAAPAPAPTVANTYQSHILYNHNIHRSNHSANSLTWSTDLENSAAVLANRCYYHHDTTINGGGYGQNIGYGVPADNIGAMITNLMYNDEAGFFDGLYGQANPDMTNFEHWGHFSQIVWKDTTEVGCATVMCDSLGGSGTSGPIPFTVCNYSPPGNFGGEYAANVGTPLGQPFFSVAM